jgi:hypothetical protein
VTANLGAGNDTLVQRTGGVHDVLTGGPGNDVFSNTKGGASIDYVYNFSAANTSGDGADGIFGFVGGRDHLVLNGITQAEFNASFVVTNAPGSAGAVITDGHNDGWSVQLIGVHETAAQLLADGAFVFA